MEEYIYFYHCKGCQKPDKETKRRIPILNNHRWARCDAYGIYTGLYCDECYDNNYPYRKDDYFDESYCGERLESDY